MPRQRFLLSTTSTLEGYIIEDYLGPVSAQFVIGTGMLTDFFSGWTDFFGAHSRSYQKKLDRIDNEALGLITEKAVRLGANAVLGLRIDHDEISGTGKSMLMVTGSGTAVRVRRDGGSTAGASSRQGAVSSYDLRAALQRGDLLAKMEARQINYRDPATWRLIVDLQIHEAAEPLLNYVDAVLSQGHMGPDDIAFIDRVFEEYFAALPLSHTLSSLYGCSFRHRTTFDRALKVLRQLDGFDAAAIARIMTSDHKDAARRAANCAIVDRPMYEDADLEVLQELAASITSRFEEAPSFERRGAFGKKQVWSCECGRDVDGSRQQCDCGRDRWGFEKGLYSPGQLSGLLHGKIAVLRTSLDNNSVAGEKDGSHFA